MLATEVCIYMMKKLLTCLLVLLTALTPALAEEAAEEPLRFYLHNSRLVPVEGGCLLHILLYKTGTSPYCLELPDIALYDAEGRVIVPESVTMERGLNPLPGGEAWCPLTLRCTLPEGAAATDFRLLSLPGEAFDEPFSQPIDSDAGYILGTGSKGCFAHLWLQRPDIGATMDADLSLYDADGGFLGNQWISWEQRTATCEGSQLRETLAELTSLGVEALNYYGVSGTPGVGYDLYIDVPLTGLAGGDIPLNADVHAYRSKQPLTVVRSNFAWQPDGRLRVNMVVMNASCEAYEMLGGVELTLTDAQGRRGFYSTLWYTAYTEMRWAPFGLMMMTFDLEMYETDFEPDAVTLSAPGRHIASTGFTTEQLDQEQFSLAKAETGWQLTGAVPASALSGADCMGVMWHALDQGTGHYLTCGAIPGHELEQDGDGAWRFDPVDLRDLPVDAEPLVRVMYLRAE